MHLHERHGREPWAKVVQERGVDAQLMRRCGDLGVSFGAHVLLQILIGRQHAEFKRRLLHLHWIEIVHVDFHDQAFGVGVRRIDSSRKLFRRTEEMHGAQQIDGVCVALDRPERLPRRRRGLRRQAVDGRL